MKAKEITTQVRIYFSDTDAVGIVYHANYLDFAERARTELLRSVDIDITKFSNQHIFFVLRGATLNYTKPAKLDDLISIKCFISKMGNSSVEFSHTMTNSAGELVCEVSCTLVCVKTEDGTTQPIRIPDEFRQHMFE